MSDWKLQHLGDHDDAGKPLPAGYYETIARCGKSAGQISRLSNGFGCLLFLVLLIVEGSVQFVVRTFRQLFPLRSRPRLLTGHTSDLWGDKSHIYGRAKVGLSGDVSRLRGDISGIFGDASRIYGDCSGLSGLVSHISGDVSQVRGYINLIHGDVSGLSGDISSEHGDVTGRVSSI